MTAQPPSALPDLSNTTEVSEVLAGEWRDTSADANLVLCPLCHVAVERWEREGHKDYHIAMASILKELLSATFRHSSALRKLSR